MAELKVEHSAESKAKPESVWERYTDVQLWREWSKGVEKSSLDGEFEAGAKGTTKAPSLPSVRFELVEVEPERRYLSKSKLPGGTLLLDHVLEPTDSGTRITHTATIEGFLDFIWTPTIGKIVERQLGPSVERLAEVAAEKEEQARKEAEEKEKRDARLEEADREFKENIKKTAGERDMGGASLPGSV